MCAAMGFTGQVIHVLNVCLGPLKCHPGVGFDMDTAGGNHSADWVFGNVDMGCVCI